MSSHFDFIIAIDIQVLTMYTKFFLLAVCSCLLTPTQAKPSGHVSHDPAHQLVAIPDLSDFSGLHYPKLDVIDLGETQKYVPEKEIKVIRTIKISKPYPVKVPVRVPYPVPVVKEVPVPVTKIVQVPVPDHSHVDVVKSVQVHASASSDHIHGAASDSGSDHYGNSQQWQPSTGGHQDVSHFAETSGQEHQVQEGSNYEYQPTYQQPSEGYEGHEGHEGH